MIEFNGRLSEKCIKKTSKRQNLKIGLMFLIPTTFVTVFTIICGIFQIQGFYLFLVWTILFVILNIAFFFLPPKSVFFRFPRKIIINNETIKTELDAMNGEWKPKVKQISKVKKVIDYGECYEIVFGLDTSWWWVCQKDLITKGSIEEFEKLFEGKIICK